MRPPNSRSRSSFLDASTPKPLVDRPVPQPAHGNASSASLPQPIDICHYLQSQQHQPHQWSYGSTRAAPLYATAATRSRGSSSHELLTWDPCESSAGATPVRNLLLLSPRQVRHSQPLQRRPCSYRLVPP